jgi:hypothetical protein
MHVHSMHDLPSLQASSDERWTGGVRSSLTAQMRQGHAVRASRAMHARFGAIVSAVKTMHGCSENGQVTQVGAKPNGAIEADEW